ncbi:selenium cofactor biosynthesis protein YqeC [Halobellus marinus]|uniref:selenium cofactor biosynthesis protein YqeC n=1 Tax=Halobellus TaxID=1073986 RepID=UPI0028B00D92|nr:selenium cofactor biosynthesis protein YqeC [Halobellus sp. DFY28]
MNLVDAFDAGSGTTCVVGAGGKKTTMAALAARLERAVVTATVRIPIFDEWVARVEVTEEPAAIVESALTEPAQPAASDGNDSAGWPLGVVPAREEKRDDRYLGYDPAVVDRLAPLDLPVLVKADGARMRRFKAPSEKEPQLPSTADTVIPIASVHVVGEPLSKELVHRVDHVADLTGLQPGEEIRPADVAAVLASESGGRKDVPAGAQTIPLLNMVDTPELATTARKVAAEIHDRVDVPRVVLAEMRAGDPIVDVV